MCWRFGAVWSRSSQDGRVYTRQEFESRSHAVSLLPATVLREGEARLCSLEVARRSEWLERAADDLREADHDLTAAPPLCEGRSFTVSRPRKRSLKAFLAAHERPFRRTHDEAGIEISGCEELWAGPFPGV